MAKRPKSPRLAEPFWGNKTNPDVVLKAVRSWFEGALPDHSPLSDVECQNFADRFRRIINRHNNIEVIRHDLPRSQLKDIDLTDQREEDARKVEAAGNQFFIEVEKFENKWGDEHQWTTGTGPILIEHIKDILSGIGARPRRLEQRGRPQEAWHAIVDEFVKLIQSTLQKAGYSGPLSPRSEVSPVAIVAARAVSWAFGKRVKAAAVKSALRMRSHKVAGFAKRYPHVPGIDTE